MQANFAKCIRGYHLVNDKPIKESVWEDINAIVLKASGIQVTSESNGSHKPGGDIVCALGGLSNKSAVYTKNKIKISSYRLTTVCSNKSPGDINQIVAEINKRKNFDYYSIIVRDETPGHIKYDWMMIPSDHDAFNPVLYKWSQTINKKNEVTGWFTDKINGSSMCINFSMSSQLWITVEITDELKKFITGTCQVAREKKYDYITLSDLL